MNLLGAIIMYEFVESKSHKFLNNKIKEIFHHKKHTEIYD